MRTGRRSNSREGMESSRRTAPATSSADIQQELTQLNANLTEAQRAKRKNTTDIKAHYRELEEQLAGFLGDLHDKMEEEYESLRDKFEQQLARLTHEMNEELDSIQKSIQSGQASGSGGDKELVVRKQQIEEALQDLQNQYDAIDREISSMGFFSSKTKKEQLKHDLDSINEEIEDFETKLAFLNDKIDQGGGNTSSQKVNYTNKQEEYQLKIDQLNEESERQMIALEERWKPKIQSAEQELERKRQNLEAQKQNDYQELESRYKHISSLETQRDALQKKLS
jgi:chromosome segregation ATPase